MTSFKKGASILMAALLSLAMAALATVPASAQEVSPDHLALARKYIDLTDQAAIYEVTLVETGIATMRTIVSQNPDIVDPVDKAITKVIETYRGRKSELLDQFARVYALRFSMPELQQIVTFYESEVGQKLAKSNLQINNELQTVMGVYQRNLKSEFFASVRAELKAAGIDV